MANLIIWTGNTLIGGVDVWVKELRRQLDGSRYNLITISDGDTFAGDEKVDIRVGSWKALEDALKRLSPAVVMPGWIHPIAGICARLNSRGARLRCLGMPHSDSEQEYYAPLAWYESAISVFVAGSPYCAQKLAARLPHRASDIRHIPYGITIPARPGKEYSLRPLKLAYFGRMEQKQKSVLDFALLAAALEKQRIDYTFDLIGSGPDREALMEALPPSGKVRFTAQVPHSRMLSMLPSYDVFLQVSGYEGFGLSMIEAMAAGVIPCVTRATGGASYLIDEGKNGFCAEVGGMDAMASSLKRISAMSPEEARAIGAAAFETVKANCDITHTSAEFTKALDACFESESRPWARAKTYFMPGGWSSDYFPRGPLGAMRALWKK